MNHEPTTVHAGWLVDGTGEPARRGVRLVLGGGRIAAVHWGTPAETGETVAGAADIDLSGCTVLPGLVDAHVHLCMSGDTDEALRLGQLAAAYPEARQAIARHLGRHLAHGVVAVRDGGDARGHVLRFKLDRGPGGRPEMGLRVAGRAWRRAGRYGSFIARPVDGGLPLDRAIAGDPDAVDHVKIVNSGLNSLVDFGRESVPQFGPEEMRSAVRAAARRGLGVMVHANGKAPVAAAVAAGCRSVEHGYFMGPENLERMAAKRVTWVPTALPMAACAELLPDPARRDVARRTLDHQLEQIALAKRLGVPVALGTDAGSLGAHHGRGVAREMRLLMNAGFSLEEAVACACADGARLLGLAGRGCLTPGMRATFVAVPGTPQDLPESLARVVCVFIDGERVDGCRRAEERG